MRIPTKQEWIDALRSGKFKQGKRLLHDLETDTYCCLGVLCKIAELNENEEIDYDDKKVGIFIDNEYCKDKYFLPTTFRIKFGISNIIQDILINKNDGDNYSFEEIANYLEQITLIT